MTSPRATAVRARTRPPSEPARPARTPQTPERPRPRARSLPAVPADVVAALRFAAGVAAAVVSITSTGSAAVAAAALAVALADRRGAVAVGLVVVAGALRYGSGSLDDWAGVQSVLGVGVEIGPVTAAASAWVSTVALVAATGAIPGAARIGAGLDRIVPALALGGLGAAVAVGPGPDGDLWMRAVATIVLAAVALGVGALRGEAVVRHRRSVAVVAGVVAVVLAGWPS